MAQSLPDESDTIMLDHPQSLGELVSEITTDLSTLMRMEIDLAKAEIKEEAVKAGKGTGMFGGGAFAGYLAAVVFTFAAVAGLSYVIGMALAAVIVGAVLAVVGLVLIRGGQAKFRSIEPKPERTVETLKEDARWARHPTT
jgi:hypothetical protein